MAKLIPGLKEYVRPESIQEALEFLNQPAREVKLYAGATSLAFVRPAVHTVVDVTRLPMRDIRSDNGRIEIGSTVTIRELERHALTRTVCGGILRRACDRLASTPLRNLITVGGNLLGGFPWSDLPVAMLALDANLVIASQQGHSTRMIAPTGSVKRHDMLQPGEILTGVQFSADRANARGAFIKFSRTEVDFGIVVVAVTFNLDAVGQITGPRVVCGSVTAEAMRIPSAEAIIDMQAPSEALFESAGQAASASITPRADTRAPEDYRREMLGVIVSRALLAAWKGEQA